MSEMTSLSLSKLAEYCKGELVGQDSLVEAFATDSAAVKLGDLFIAIRGARVDGHSFVSEALQAGAVGTLAEQPVPGAYVRVPSVVQALADMASRFRSDFAGPVIGITGSAGKTSTKEFVAAALAPLGPVLKTQGNRNTEYTAPLLWAELSPEHRAVVVEMSMRGFGHIAHLASFSGPTIAVISNIGWAHVEMVGSREGVARAKGEILDALPKDGVAILWQEDDFLETLRKRAGDRKVVTFGWTDQSDLQIESYRPLDWSSSAISGHCAGAPWSAVVPAIGRHMALNAASAILAANVCGVDLVSATSALAHAELPPMRMQALTINGANVLLDTYNASPPSMVAAIETFAELPVWGRRRAIIGEMKELGVHGPDAHRALAKTIEAHRLDEVLFVGELARLAFEELRGVDGVQMAESPDDVREFLALSSEGDGVLIKGSRALELEKCVEAWSAGANA